MATFTQFRALRDAVRDTPDRFLRAVEASGLDQAVLDALEAEMLPALDPEAQTVLVEQAIQTLKRAGMGDVAETVRANVETARAEAAGDPGGKVGEVVPGVVDAGELKRP
jgi:hypothetical protein